MTEKMIFMHGSSAHILSPAPDSSTANPALMRQAAEFSCLFARVSTKSATGCLILRRTNIFVLKSVDSFPTLPIMRLHTAGVISSVGRASPLHGGGRRFEPVIAHHFGSLAQLVEQLTFNQLVAGSNPARPTNVKKRPKGAFLLSAIPASIGSFTQVLLFPADISSLGRGN